MKILKFGALALLLIIVILNKLYWQEIPAEEIASFECYQLDESCFISTSKLKLKISSDSHITEMKQFKIKIEKLDDSNYRPVKISYNMKEMDMGLNEYELTSSDGKLWQTFSLIPFCMSGLNDWVATIYLENKENKLSYVEVKFKVSKK